MPAHAPRRTPPRAEIAARLEMFLRTMHIRRVYVAGAGITPPPLAYVTPFTRVSVLLDGEHAMEIAGATASRVIRPAPGDAVLVPANTWNLPHWDTPVTVLTILFGAKQIGASLVRHPGGEATDMLTLKTGVHGGYDDPTQHILRALTAAVTIRSRSSRVTRSPRSPLPRLLVESLLHACWHMLTRTDAEVPRKAVRTFEAICLYVQEHYQQPLTREDIAQQFRLAPTHVSRLFRHEGLMRFTDYVNLVRVNRAKFLLRSYEMPLKEIAARCGYHDTAYFCQVFKRMSAMTPTQYRGVQA